MNSQQETPVVPTIDYTRLQHADGLRALDQACRQSGFSEREPTAAFEPALIPPSRAGASRD